MTPHHGLFTHPLSNSSHKISGDNGYPDRMIDRVLLQQKQCNPSPTTQQTTTSEEKKLLFLPYAKGLSERIDRVCYKLGIRAVFKSGNTLRQSLMRVKSRRRDEQKKGVVYEVPCGGCNQVYIGETGRSLEVCLKEHKYAVRTANMNNGIAAHAWNFQHPVNWDGARARCFEQHMWRRKVLEAIVIQQTENNSNLDCGLNLNQVWSPLLD